MGFGRGLLLWLIGLPLPIIILLGCSGADGGHNPPAPASLSNPAAASLRPYCPLSSLSRSDVRTEPVWNSRAS
jgi:hypothetical protein